MRKALILLVTALLLFSLCQAEGAGFAPIPWEVDVSPYAPKNENYLPDNGGYHDDSLDIRIETFVRDKTTVMAVYVKVADASQIRTTSAAPSGSSKAVAPVAAMAKRSKAVLAVNGDYYGYHNQGIVIRNGKEKRFNPVESRDTLIIDSKGDFHIIEKTTKEKYQALVDSMDAEVIHTFCFGPALVTDGVELTDLSTVLANKGNGKKTQRIAIGQTGPLEYLILTCEGPENKGSVGFDLLQIAALCKEMGCINAYNLDGGSSSTVVLKDKKINAVSSYKTRSVTDCIYFATLVP